MTKPRKVRGEFIAAAVVVAIIVYALIADWWQKHPTIGWIIVAVLLASLAYSLYKFPTFRQMFTRKVKQVGAKVVFEEAASSREPIPRTREPKYCGEPTTTVRIQAVSIKLRFTYTMWI